MRHRVLIIAAPFGYGPAARALLIADALSGIAEVTVLSSRDAYLFIEQHRAPQVKCLDGIFSRRFPVSRLLTEFDTFISVNNDPAVRHLIFMGLAGRTVFVDSILPWRTGSAAARFAQPIRAYLVQDCPGAASLLNACNAQRVELTAPIVWPSTKADGSDLHGRAAARRIALHLGGVTSPLVPWAAVRRPIEAIVNLMADLARRHARELVVLGNGSLASIPALAQATSGTAIRLAAQANPIEAAALVENSELLVTTPGIGMIYEAMEREVPTLLLPPMNSTQLHQYSVLTAHGYPGSLSEQAAASLREAADGAPWDRQTDLTLRWLQGNLQEALACLPLRLNGLLADQDAAAAREELLRRQKRLRESLSQNNALDILRKVVALDGSHSAGSPTQGDGRQASSETGARADSKSAAG